MRALRYWDKSGLVCLSYDDNNQLCGITVKDLKNNSSPEPDRSRYATPEFNNDTADTTVPATAFADETSADEKVLKAKNGYGMLFLWILPLKHHHILLSLQR